MSRTLRILILAIAVAATLMVAWFFFGGVVLDECSMESSAEAAAADLLEKRRRALEERPRYEPIEEIDFEARSAEIRAEYAAKRAKFIEENGERMDEARKAQKRRPRRRIKRYVYDSPAETRAELWNPPADEHERATETALLRVCISEADASKRGLQDCVGIYQVVRNIRSRSCDRARVRKITQCDDDGETLLSVMRRASKSILGIVPPRSRRSTWISELELGCEQPASWTGTKSEWERQYGHERRCPRVAKLASHLVQEGTLPQGMEYKHLEWVPGRPVTWGGRCESGRGACDDDIACARGLARLFSDTFNAFWCVPGQSGCSTEIDDVCLKRGHPSLADRRAAKALEERGQSVEEEPAPVDRQGG